MFLISRPWSRHDLFPAFLCVDRVSRPLQIDFIKHENLNFAEVYEIYESTSMKIEMGV